ncbi:hypothetical protein BGX24_002485, partial [Mortierella sp. AD032]
LGPSASPNRSHQTGDSRADPGVGDMSIRSRIHINPLDIVNFVSLEPRQRIRSRCMVAFKLYSADRLQPTAQTLDGARTVGMGRRYSQEGGLYCDL